jgi:hypothetical protein
MTTRTWIYGRRRVGAALLFGMSLLVVTGCSGGGTPGATAGPESPGESASSSSPAASPPPTASYKPADAAGKAQNVPVPELPEAAKAETKEGLEAFARYWFAQLNFAYETGRIVGVESVTSPNCEFCSNITRSLAKNYENERWLVGGRIETPSVTTAFEGHPDGQHQVIVQVRQAVISYYDASGKEFRAPTPASDTGNVMVIAFNSGSWQLLGLHPIR